MLCCIESIQEFFSRSAINGLHSGVPLDSWPPVASSSPNRVRSAHSVSVVSNIVAIASVYRARDGGGGATQCMVTEIVVTCHKLSQLVNTFLNHFIYLTLA